MGNEDTLDGHADVHEEKNSNEKPTDMWQSPLKSEHLPILLGDCFNLLLRNILSDFSDIIAQQIEPPL